MTGMVTVSRVVVAMETSRKCLHLVQLHVLADSLLLWVRFAEPGWSMHSLHLMPIQIPDCDVKKVSIGMMEREETDRWSVNQNFCGQ